MRTCIIIILLTLFTTPLRAGDHPQPVNPDISPEAKALLDYIYSIKGKNILAGQHNYPCSLSSFTEKAHEITGFYPVIWGQDFSFDGKDKDHIACRPQVVNEAILKHSQGFIVTMMWHAVRPIDDEPAGWKTSVQAKLTDAQWDSLVTPCTRINLRWQAQVDVIAGYLKQLQAANVPILWRPYHEMNGIWFWWGDKKGETGFKKLWIMLYDRLVNYHQLNNLIWVWNTNAPRDLENDQAYAYELYYPGAEYVDILAADVYHNDYKQSHHDDLLKLAAGKPIALGEVGEMPTPEIINEQPEWTWFMVWTNWLWDHNSPETVKALYNDPRTLTLKVRF